MLNILDNDTNTLDSGQWTVDSGQSQHNHGGHIRGLLWDGQIPDCHGYRSDTLDYKINIYSMT